MLLIFRIFYLLFYYLLSNTVLSQGASSCPDLTGFDFIIVGSGSAGSAIAHRLTEISKVRVLLFEAGGEPPLITNIPTSFTDPVRVPLESKYTFNTVPQENCCSTDPGGKTLILQGKGLGGSSNINGLTYTRGNKQDFENWKNLGNPGWGYEDVLEYFLKLEDYRIPHRLEDAPYHNKGGPVVVSHPSYETTFAQTFLEAGQELGYFLVDVNGKNQTGFTFEPLTIKDDLRCSNYRAYIQPSMNRTNLKIMSNCTVTKILFNESKAAIGVEFGYKDTKCIANATKEIIISAGALNSPKLLMLSGVGPKDALTKLQIPIVQDLPGVGQNLSDHIYLHGIKAFVDEGSVPARSSFTGPDTTKKLYLPAQFETMAYLKSSLVEGDFPDYEIIQQGSWSLNLSIRFHQAFNPDNDSEEEVIKKATEEYKKSFKTNILKGLDESQLSSSSDAEVLNFFDKMLLQMHTTVLLTKSRGYLTLNTSNPYDPPIIDPKYLSHPDDLKILSEGLNKTIEVMKTNAYKKRGIRLFDFGKFCGCGSMDNLTKEYLECIIKKFTASGFHFISSCMMAPLANLGVVNNKLQVYGVSNLRVADSSVIPVPITGHIHVASIMVGEYGADIIKQFYKLT